MEGVVSVFGGVAGIIFKKKRKNGKGGKWEATAERRNQIDPHCTTHESRLQGYENCNAYPVLTAGGARLRDQKNPPNTQAVEN
jgi:hypothetical protein